MGKYRHTVTGKVAELDDDYASAIKALEPVDESTPTDPCKTCGPDYEPSGEAPVAATADEPLLTDQGE